MVTVFEKTSHIDNRDIKLMTGVIPQEITLDSDLTVYENLMIVAPGFDFFNYYTELVITPMLFFSGVFFPLDKFPAWVKSFAQFLPLTHAVNISRAAFSGESSPGLALDFLYIILLEAVAFYLGIKLMKRRLIK